MQDIPILSRLKECKAIFCGKYFRTTRNFSPKLIKVPVLLFDTLEYVKISVRTSLQNADIEISSALDELGPLIMAEPKPDTRVNLLLDEFHDFSLGLLSKSVDFA